MIIATERHKKGINCNGPVTQLEDTLKIQPTRQDWSAIMSWKLNELNELKQRRLLQSLRGS